MSSRIDGALLINKHANVSSFGIIELLQRQVIQQKGIQKRNLPKLGHGGTLDPFATGLLIVLVGRAAKLARYFLGANKSYEGLMRFGVTTIPGDPTSPISETAEGIPTSIEAIREMAQRFSHQPYLQTPPMHSAKKKNGKPLYELARAGLDVEREPKLCRLFEFQLDHYQPPVVHFKVTCSSGTYVRTLAQDFARWLGTVGMLDTLHRTASGPFRIEKAWSTQAICEAAVEGKSWHELPCWIPFDRLLDGHLRADATPLEREFIFQGKQKVLEDILLRTSLPIQNSTEKNPYVAIYCENSLIAVARKESTEERQEQDQWAFERVFTAF